MPLTDADLLDLLNRTAQSLDEEAAWLVDVELTDRGQQRPTIPARDRDFFDAVNDTAQAIRDLIEMVKARQAR